MSCNEMTPMRPSTKRFSLASSASQPRPSVHFDEKAVISQPEIINSSLKRRLSAVAYPPRKPSPESHCDDRKSSRRRQSIVLSPTKPSLAASSPKVDPIQVASKNNDDSPRRRRPSIVLPLMTTSTPDIYQTDPISPRKRRFSTITPPLHDSGHNSGISASPSKRRFSGVSASSDDTTKYIITESSSSLPRTRTRRLSIIPPSINKPPPQICAEVNQRIRSTFHYPDFDFIQHVQHRSYVVRTQHFDETESVTMLDKGVDGLLQPMFEKLPPQLDTRKNIDIRSSPGKGLGMFARKEIAGGEAFLVEYPTVVAPYVIGLSIGLSQLYADIFRRLSAPVFAELMDLSSSSLISGQTKDVHEAIMRINALAIELPVPDREFRELETHRAIFLQTSRCNHSCGPNARWEWDLKRFSLVLTAVRPIREGEEITIPYIAPNMHSEERQDILSNFYGFKCLCPFCTLPHDDIRQSDLARSTLSSTWIKGNPEPSFTASAASPVPPLPSFDKWCLDPTFPDDILINSHLQALRCIEREGLHILDTSTHKIDHPARDICRHLDAIAMCYGALEDADNFRIWMERVSEVRLRKKPEQKLVFQKWLSNPTSFPVWGWRRAFCGEEWERERDGEDSESGLSACVNMGMFEFI